MKLQKEKGFVPTQLLAFGPPRLVFGMDEWEEEVDRQKLLVAVGLLRRWDERTWGWSMAVRSDDETKQVWHWSSSGNFMESKHTGVEDFERAWADVTSKRRAS